MCEHERKKLKAIGLNLIAQRLETRLWCYKIFGVLPLKNFRLPTRGVSKRKVSKMHVPAKIEDCKAGIREALISTSEFFTFRISSLYSFRMP